MELEQRNEVVWSVKRKNQAEKFLLRLVDENGNKQIGLGLEKEGKQILFEMENEEFQNFYGILSAFRDLADKKADQKIPPITLQTQISNENIPSKPATPSIPIKSQSAIPIQEPPKAVVSIEPTPITQETNDDMDNLAAIAGALNELSDKFNTPGPEPHLPEPQPVTASPVQVPKVNAGKMVAPQVAPNTPIVDNGPINGVDAKKSTASKPKLNPNEWDPW